MTTISAAEASAIVRTLASYATPDDTAVRRLLWSCRQRRSDATSEEVCHFVEVKGSQARHKVNPMGFLITAVTNCFEGESFEAYRRSRTADIEQQQETRRTQEMAQKSFAEADAKMTLSDPFASPADITAARALLPDWQPSEAGHRDFFDRRVMSALDGLQRGGSTEFREQCSSILSRAAEIDRTRLEELKAMRTLDTRNLRNRLY